MRRKLLWVFAVLVALLLIAAVALPRMVNIDSFRPRLEALLTAKLHREVKLGTMGLRLLPLPTVTVASGSVAGATGENAPLLQFKIATARVAFWPLLHKQVDVRSVDIDGLSINLRQDATGKFNVQSWLANLSATPPATPATPPSAITLSSLHLSNLHVLYSGPDTAAPLDIPLDLTLSRFGNAHGALVLLAGQTEIKYAGQLDLDRLDGKFTSSKFRFEDINPLLKIAGTGLPRGLTVAGPVKLDGSIKMEFAQPAKTELQAAVELNGGTLASGAPGETAPMAEFKKAVAQISVWPLPRNQIELSAVAIDGMTLRLVRDRSGKFNLQSWLSSLGSGGKAGNSPVTPQPAAPPAAVTIDHLHLSNAHLFYGETAGKSPLDIPLELTLTGFGGARGAMTLSAEKNELQYDGRLDLNGLDGKFSSSRFRLEAATPLLIAAGAGLPPGFSATGEVKLEGRVKVDYASPAPAVLQAAIELRGGTLQMPTLKVPLTGVTFLAQLSPETIDLSGLSFKLLKSDLSGRVKISNWRTTPRLTFDFSSELLEMGEITDQLQPGNPNTGNIGGDGSGDLPLARQAFSAEGSLQVKNGGFGIFRFSSMKARVLAVPAQLKLSELSAQFFKGMLNADALINNRTAGFSFNARLERMDLGDFMKVAAGQPLVTGSADAKVNGQGRLAAWQQLTGNASLTTTNGVIARFPLLEKINQALSLTGLSTVNDRDLAYDRLTADFILGGARARTDNLQLHAALLDADAKGVAGFDAALDFAGHAVLSKARSSEMINRAGTLKYAADKDGRITLPFTAKGLAGAPVISIDTQALLKQAAGGVVEEKKDELRQKVKDRLGDFLGGLLGGGKKSSPSSPSSP